MPRPTLQYTLDSWTGLDAFSPPDLMDAHHLADCANVDFDEAGTIEKRRGASRVALSLSGRIHLIYDLQGQQGFIYGATDRLRTLIVAGATLYVVKDFNRFNTIEATFAVPDAKHYAATTNNGVCFVSNETGGVPKLLTPVAGTWRYVDASLLAPTVAPTGSIGGVGGLTGEYRYRYTYEDYWGNESNPSDPSAPVMLGEEGAEGKYANVTVTASPDVTVQFINLYVLPPGQSIYQYVSTHPNTTATIAHWESDAQVLGGAALEYDHESCPPAKYVTIYNDMLCVAGDSGLPDMVYVSNNQYHRQFATATDFARAVSGDGQPIRGFASSFQALIVGKSDSLFIGEGEDNQTFQLRPHDQSYGVLGMPSMTFIHRTLAYFSDDGIYVDDTINPTELSVLIRNKMRTLNPANLAADPPRQVAANYKYYKQTFWSVRRAAGAGANDTMLVWNYERKAWTLWTGNAAEALGAVQDFSDYEMMYGGDNAGNVFLYNPPNGGSPNSDSITGSPVAISAFAETPWLHLPRLKGLDDWERTRTIGRFLIMYVSGESQTSNITMTTNYFIDFDDTIRATFSTTHTAYAWPKVKPDPKKIGPFGGPDKPFTWVKFRFTNNNLHEHFKIHKLVFGFKTKPAID
jgi:hypothetical protein